MIDAGSRKQTFDLDWVDRLADERAQREGDTATEMARMQTLLRNVICNVSGVCARRYDREPLWVLVGLITGTGKRNAERLCWQFGWSPDATVRSCRLGKAMRA